MLEMMNFKSFVVILLIITSQVLPFSFGRIVFNWSYSDIAISTLFTTLIVAYITFFYFLRMQIEGISLTLIMSLFLATFFVFVKKKSKVRFKVNEVILGHVYWIVLTIIFSISIVKSWDISASIGQVYLLRSDPLDLFIIFCSVFVISGAISMYMFFYEWKIFWLKKV